MPSSTLEERPPKKRLVICCDGTWQASNHGLQTIPSNIAKLSRAVKFYERTSDNQFIHQVVFYSAGVGTGTDTARNLGFIQDKIAWLVRKWEGAVGAGLDENVCEAYNFIVNNYVHGDELYFFGFSRGAYTARATAGLVASVGICTNPMLDSFYKMYNAYKLREPGKSLKDTPWAKSVDGKLWFGHTRSDVVIKVVGVFDTVGSLGYPDTGHFNVTHFNKRFGFHDTNLHPSIEYGFHALALDEHRRPFSPTLWSLPPVGPGQRQTKKLIQCWFPGMHINVGGGNSDQLEANKKHLTDMEAMANITYAWMIDRVRQYTDLVFNEEELKEIVLRYSDAQQALITQDDTCHGGRAYQGWGMGPVADSWEGMKLGGSKVRSPGHYPEKGKTFEYIHPVVAYAKRENAPKHYDSAAMKDFDRTRREDSKNPGFDWKKSYIDGRPRMAWLLDKLDWLIGKPAWAQGTAKPVTIPEYKIPQDTASMQWIERSLLKQSSVADSENDNLDEASMRAFSETENFIRQLDRDNTLDSTEQ